MLYALKMNTSLISHKSLPVSHSHAFHTCKPNYQLFIISQKHSFMSQCLVRDSVFCLKWLPTLLFKYNFYLWKFSLTPYKTAHSFLFASSVPVLLNWSHYILLVYVGISHSFPRFWPNFSNFIFFCDSPVPNTHAYIIHAYQTSAR